MRTANYQLKSTESKWETYRIIQINKRKRWGFIIRGSEFNWNTQPIEWKHSHAITNYFNILFSFMWLLNVWALCFTVWVSLAIPLSLSLYLSLCLTPILFALAWISPEKIEHKTNKQKERENTVSNLCIWMQVCTLAPYILEYCGIFILHIHSNRL